MENMHLLENDIKKFLVQKLNKCSYPIFALNFSAMTTNNFGAKTQ